MEGRTAPRFQQATVTESEIVEGHSADLAARVVAVPTPALDLELIGWLITQAAIAHLYASAMVCAGTPMMVRLNLRLQGMQFRHPPT